MTSIAPTFSATIHTDSGDDIVVTLPYAARFAEDLLNRARDIPDAIAISSKQIEVEEALSRHLLDWYGAEADENGVHPNSFGDALPDILHDNLRDMVRESQAAQDYFDDNGFYSMEAHNSDERAMLMIGVA